MPVPSRTTVAEPLGDHMLQQDELIVPDDLTDEDRSPDAPGAAVRLLEIATRSADELVYEARAEAAALVATAQADADQLLAAAQAEADQVRAALEQQRTERTEEISRLERLEQAHRERMRSHLNELLTQLEPASAD